jgi:hypothetical protein
MAVEFARWMDRWVAGVERQMPALCQDDFTMLPDEQLACHPRQDRNIYSINADMARELPETRPEVSLQAAAQRICHAETPAATPASREGKPALAWFHYVQEILLQPETGIELPATFLYPAKPGWKGAALLYFDDRGRWTDLRQQRLLANVTGFIDRETDGPAVFTVDLRGWGDSRPADVGYDIAGWGHRDRWNAYVSAALGDHVLAMRVRDGLAALAYLRTRPEVDPARIVIGGRGMGGVVALHVAAIDGAAAGVFALDSLATFESLASSPQYTWPVDAFLPGVLQSYDLPDLAGLPIPTLIAHPLGATQEPLNKEEAEETYRKNLERETFKLVVEADDNVVVGFAQTSAPR